MTPGKIPADFCVQGGLLADRVILITGASDGIGKALALRCAGLGAQVVLHGRNTRKLESVYDEIEALDGAARPSIAVLDLLTADGDAYASLAHSLGQEFGRLDGLVHNASILGNRHSIEQYDPAEWQQVLHVNLTSAFVLTQLLLPLLKASSNASVLFTSSGVGRIGKAYWGAYAVSKFGTEGLSQVLASETAHSDLRVNCVNPGPVRTRMRLAAYPAENPESLVAAEDILDTYLYLLSSAAQGVTGQSFDCQ